MCAGVQLIVGAPPRIVLCMCSSKVGRWLVPRLETIRPKRYDLLENNTYLLTLPSASEASGNNQQQAKFVYTKNKKTIIAK